MEQRFPTFMDYFEVQIEWISFEIILSPTQIGRQNNQKVRWSKDRRGFSGLTT